MTSAVVGDDRALSGQLAAILALPRALQPAAAATLGTSLPAAQEAWNSSFADGTLFEAFSGSSVARGVYAANREVLRPLLGDGFRVVEIGGGNGRLWRGLLADGARGDIVVVDPHPDGALGVAAQVPKGVTVRHVCASAQDADLPAADVVIASLVLHHVAGTDRTHRELHGLVGDGKREILARAAKAAATVVLNEADVYCDLDLPPGDPLLLERLCDSYVRRFAVSLAHDIDHADNPQLAARLTAIVRDWALGQLAIAGVPIVQRDVYERDVPSWLLLLDTAGLKVVSRRFTDPWMLFCQYVCHSEKVPMPVSPVAP